MVTDILEQSGIDEYEVFHDNKLILMSSDSLGKLTSYVAKNKLIRGIKSGEWLIFVRDGGDESENSFNRFARGR